MAEVKLEELGKSVGESLTLSEERASRFMEAFISTLDDSLSAGKEVHLEGLGTLGIVGADGKPLPALYHANLVGDICGRLKEPRESQVQSLVRGLVDAIRKAVLEGRRVILNDIGTFEVVQEKPQIERQPKGHRLIRPAMTVFRFHSNRAVTTPAGEGRVSFRGADDFRKKVEQLRESAILLVVPTRDYFVKTLEYYFETAGWDLKVCERIEEAEREVESGKAYLVVLDAGMAGYERFMSRVKTNRATNSIPIILLFPHGQAFEKLADIIVMGDENLAQPFEFRKLLDYADAEILSAAEERLLFLQQLNLHLPTEEAVIERGIEEAHRLFETSGLNEEGQVAMSAAFREAMINAAQHGNRYKKEKKIEVQYLLDAERVTVVIKDQGDGFNHELYVKSGQSGSAIAAARERHAQGRMGGLGILLMLRCCDRLEYNQKGNQITLTKFIKPQS